MDLPIQSPHHRLKINNVGVLSNKLTQLSRTLRLAINYI